ncbi:Extracellular ribonuclease precursor [hydrothermal vent metagenome]|uniref:Extracellular ribonuclease n=1 Tax=hydrothermal vent metagenome TaxID=652676 RepID=A0A3B0VGL2_9ZZZZ
MKHSNKVKLSLITCLILIFNINLAWSQPDSGYYATVDESSPAALKASLHNIIKDHTRIPYTSSATDTWDILELAGEDVDNNNNVIALYKNSTYVKVTGGNSNYNREHSWPKSYGFPDDNSGNYPYTDMHHLFIANGSYNSYRGNKPFDICVSACTERPTNVNNGRGGVGQSNFTKTGIWDVWNARQGDVARALFYMAVRYEGGTHSITNRSEPDLELTDNLALINASQTGSNESLAYMGLLSVLINWHNSDPVDIYEHQHNEAVASAQGNRNPFIDNPNWVGCVFELVCNGGGTDTTPPNAPANLTGNGTTVGQISLDWFNNTESDLAGYSIYRALAGGGSFSKLNTSLVAPSAYTDSTVVQGSSYFYKLTASDNAGNESGFSTEISVTAATSPAGNVLTNGVTVSGLAASTGNSLEYTMTVPSAATNLTFNIVGGSGDADLYVRFGSAPTQDTYDCRPWLNGNVETCNETAQVGTYYIMVRAYTAFSGVSLTGSYSTGSNAGEVFSSTSNVNIPDNNSTGATSNISVNRTGAANNIKVSYNIIHTYIGDLSVQLVDPTGSVVTLRNRSGGSANNINESKSISKGSTTATGTWGLKVIDSAGIDTGYINSWSIEFL